MHIAVPFFFIVFYCSSDCSVFLIIFYDYSDADRSPEVLLGVPYNGAIDMWSLACVCAEMYLGLPLFPGVSQHNQLSRIIEMMGYPPDSLIEGKNGSKYFSRVAAHSSSSSGSSSISNSQQSGPVDSPRDFWANSPNSPTVQKYHLKTAEEYALETSTEIPVLRKYLRYSKLDDVIMKCPLANKSRMTPDQKKEEMLRRLCFLNFLEGLFKMNPFERWTAKQAANHPFVTNAVFTGQFVPIVDPKINERKLAYFVQTQQKDTRGRGSSYVQGNNGGGNLDVSSDGMHVFRPLQFRRLSEPLRLSPAGVKVEEERGAGPLLQRGQSVREPDSLSSPSQSQMQYQHQSLPYNGSQYMQQQQQYLRRQQITQQQQYAELLQSPPEQYSAYSASTPEGVWANYTTKDPSSNSQYLDAMAQANSQAALTMSRNAASCDDLPSASMMAGKGRNMGGDNDSSSRAHNFTSDLRDNRGQGFASSAKASNHLQQQQTQQSQQSRSYMQGENGGGLPYPKRNGVQNPPRYDQRQNNQRTGQSPQSYQAPSFLQQQLQFHEMSPAHRGLQQQQHPTQHQQQHYPVNQQQQPQSSSQSNFPINGVNADYEGGRRMSGSMDSTSGSGFEGFGGSMTDVPLMMTDFGQALMRPELDERRRLHSMQQIGGPIQYDQQQYGGERQQWQNQQQQQTFTRQRMSQQGYYPPQQQQNQQHNQQNQQSQHNHQNHIRKPPQQRMSTSHEKHDSKLLNEMAIREQTRLKMQHAASSSDAIGNSNAMSALTNRIMASGNSRGDDQSDQGRSVSFAVAKSNDAETHNYVAQLVVSNRNSGFVDATSPHRLDTVGGAVRSSSDSSANSIASKNPALKKGISSVAASSSSKPPIAVGDVTDVLADWDPFFSGDDFEMEEDTEESRSKGDSAKKALRGADSSRSGSTAISDRGSTDDGDIDPDVDESEWRSAGSRGNSADVRSTPELPYRKIA